MNVMVIASHSDDAVLGMGGTIHRLVNEGNCVSVLILAKLGYGARDILDKDKLGIMYYSEEVCNAHTLLGIKETYFGNFQDNEFDKDTLLTITKKIEDVKEIVKPEIIFTHKEDCLNIDHQKAYEATITATRPKPNEYVKEVYTYEVLSSSEWNFSADSVANVYYEISKENLDKKIEAMKIFESEIREFPHPRSIKGIITLAEKRGMESSICYAEAFRLVRSLR